MEDQIIKILQSARTIKPDAEFERHSRAVILTLPPHRRLSTGILESLKFGTAIVFATMLIFILVGGLSYFKITNISPTLLTSFDEQSLQKEADGLDFSIQLGEVKYFDKSAEQVAKLLEEISQPKNEKDSGNDIILNSTILWGS